MEVLVKKKIKTVGKYIGDFAGWFWSLGSKIFIHSDDYAYLCMEGVC